MISEFEIIRDTAISGLDSDYPDAVMIQRMKIALEGIRSFADGCAKVYKMNLEWQKESGKPFNPEDRMWR